MDIFLCNTIEIICGTIMRTQGVTLFRMPRDDAYLAQLLEIVGRLYTQHVLPGLPPPTDFNFESHSYQALISATLAIAKKTPVLATLPQPQVAPAADGRAFLT